MFAMLTKTSYLIELFSAIVLLSLCFGVKYNLRTKPHLLLNIASVIVVGCLLSTSGRLIMTGLQLKKEYMQTIRYLHSQIRRKRLVYGCNIN